jgi:hypothetical protein
MKTYLQLQDLQQMESFRTNLIRDVRNSELNDTVKGTLVTKFNTWFDAFVATGHDAGYPVPNAPPLVPVDPA